MNRIKVIKKNGFVNDIKDNVMLSDNGDTLTIRIKGHNDKIMLVNDIYSKVVIIFEDNASANLLEIKNEQTTDNGEYQYILNNNSKAAINKFYYMKDYNEDVTVHLNGLKADILFNLSVMSTGFQKYNININHNNKETTSNVFNHGVSFNDSNIDFNVDGIVKKGMINSSLNQDNRIMTMNNGKGTIRPNLFIEENMIEAKHGATIGRFNENEIFYLQARGIPEYVGYQLLLKGFLLDRLSVDENIREELNNIIEKFGR